MSVSIRIPAVLRRYTDGQEEVQAQGATVREVIADLTRDSADFKKMLFDESGKFRFQSANIFVNDEDMRFLQELETPIKDGDQLLLLGAAAGGR